METPGGWESKTKVPSVGGGGGVGMDIFGTAKKETSMHISTELRGNMKIHLSEIDISTWIYENRVRKKN